MPIQPQLGEKWRKKINKSSARISKWPADGDKQTKIQDSWLHHWNRPAETSTDQQKPVCKVNQVDLLPYTWTLKLLVSRPIRCPGETEENRFSNYTNQRIEALSASQSLGFIFCTDQQTAEDVAVFFFY